MSQKNTTYKPKELFLISIEDVERSLIEQMFDYKYEVLFISGEEKVRKFYEICNKPKLFDTLYKVSENTSATEFATQQLELLYKTKKEYLKKRIYDIANEHKKFIHNPKYYLYESYLKKNNRSLSENKYKRMTVHLHPLDKTDISNLFNLLDAFVEYYEYKEKEQIYIQDIIAFFLSLGDIERFKKYRKKTLHKYIAGVVHKLLEINYLKKDSIDEEDIQIFPKKAYGHYNKPIIKGGIRDPSIITSQLKDIPSMNIGNALDLWKDERDYTKLAKFKSLDDFIDNDNEAELREFIENETMEDLEVLDKLANSVE